MRNKCKHCAKSVAWPIVSFRSGQYFVNIKAQYLKIWHPGVWVKMCDWYRWSAVFKVLTNSPLFNFFNKCSPRNARQRSLILHKSLCIPFPNPAGSSRQNLRTKKDFETVSNLVRWSQAWEQKAKIRWEAMFQANSQIDSLRNPTKNGHHKMTCLSSSFQVSCNEDISEWIRTLDKTTSQTARLGMQPSLIHGYPYKFVENTGTKNQARGWSGRSAPILAWGLPPPAEWAQATTETRRPKEPASGVETSNVSRIQL